MIGQRRASLRRQPVGRFLDLLAAQAIDDAGIACVLLGNEAPEPLARAHAARLGNAVADVRAIEARDELLGLFEGQLAHDLRARLLVGRCGERDARHIRKAFGQNAELAILGTEIVPPLRDAVRFVDGEERDIGRGEKFQQARLHEPLGCDIDQVEDAGAHGLLDLDLLGPGQRGVQEGCIHAERFQRVDLILHECDQRRDDHCYAGAYQRRDLIADRLAAPRRHEDEGVAPAEQGPDRALLVRAEGAVAECCLEDGLGPSESLVSIP